MNKWICYDFMERRILPSHYAIRSGPFTVGAQHLKSWIVETSQDGEEWEEIDKRDDDNESNGPERLRIFAVGSERLCRFVRLVNIGRNHVGNDRLSMSAWEIFGTVLR
jgi:hypothetical protein